MNKIFSNFSTRKISKHIYSNNTNYDDLISVLIPCRNASEYIESAVTSISNQTYTNLEILILENNSNDTTLDKAYSLADLDKDDL